MTHKTARNKSFQYSFILTEQELSRIYNEMGSWMGQITKSFTSSFELKYRNNIKEELISLDEVLAQNRGVWIIEALKITLRDTQQSGSSYISLEFTKVNIFSRDSTKSVNYEIQSDNQLWVYSTCSFLEERIVNVRRNFPYKYINQNVNFLLLILFGFYGLIFIPVFINNLINTFIHPSSMSLSDLYSYAITTLLFIIISIYSLYYYLVPICCFCWGDYAEIYKRRESIARYIVFAIIVTTILGLLASIIANYITAKLGKG